MTQAVYLIHLERPYKHARHYIGWTGYDVAQRLAHHRAGQGARLLQVVAQAGIPFDVVRTWPDQPKAFERRLKRRKDARKLCPVCNPAGWAHRETHHEH